MGTDMVPVGRCVREVREAAGVSQDEARLIIGVSPPTYAHIESGEGALKGAELVQLADRFDVRASAITGLAQVRNRARYEERTDGGPSVDALRERLYAALELDAYLTDQGIPATR